LLTWNRVLDGVQTAVASIFTDKKLVYYGLLLLALHVSGVLFLYDVWTEFDIVPHFWFGYVLSEYTNKVASSVSLQSRLVARFGRHSNVNTGLQAADFLLRLAGFLLIGGLFWEGAELAFSYFLGIAPDSFFAFPATLRNMDGAIDVLVGILGAVLAFLIATRKTGRGGNVA